MRYDKTRLHKDGTISYWSVHEQVYKERVKSVPDQELAAMSGDERAKVTKHLDAYKEWT